MKPTALLVNTSHEADRRRRLVDSLSGTSGFAAADVYEDEPIFNADHPLPARQRSLHAASGLYCS
jgi:D-3-phosphoglycerate dehydrogenase